MSDENDKNFCILRTTKHKSARTAGGSIKHNARRQMPDNANPALLADNIDLMADRGFNAGYRNNDEIEYFRQRISGMRKHKSAVLAHELVMSFSAKVAERLTKSEQLEFFKDSLQWAVDLHGGDIANVVSAHVHYDEKTPHLHIVMTPIIDKKWSSKHIFGGKKDRMSQLQTDFWQQCGKKYGMDRGIEGSKATHTKTAKWGKMVDEEIPRLQKLVSDLEARSNALESSLKLSEQKLTQSHAERKKIAQERDRAILARNKSLAECKTLKAYAEKTNKQLNESKIAVERAKQALHSDWREQTKPYLDQHREYLLALKDSPYRAIFDSVSSAFAALPEPARKVIKPLYDEIKKVNSELTEPARLAIARRRR